jgi:hypothetical protein
MEIISLYNEGVIKMERRLSNLRKRTVSCIVSEPYEILTNIFWLADEPSFTN